LIAHNAIVVNYIKNSFAIYLGYSIGSGVKAKKDLVLILTKALP
jgi:hypothetical protein